MLANHPTSEFENAELRMIGEVRRSRVFVLWEAHYAIGVV